MTGMGVFPVLPKAALWIKHVAEKKGEKGSEAEPALIIQAVKACVSERLLNKTRSSGIEAD